MQELSFPIHFKGTEYTGHYIKDRDTAQIVLAKLMAKDCLFGLDFETAALPQYSHNRKAALSPHMSVIRLLQVFDGKNAIVFDLLSLGDPSMFVPFLESKKFIAHNALFELMFSMKLGVTQMDIGCSMLMSTLLLQATYATDDGLGVGLDDMCERVLGEKLVKASQTSDWAVPDLTFEQVEYAALDSIVTVLLAEKLANGIVRHGMQRIYKLYKEVQHPIAAMQLNGMNLNVDEHRKKIAIWREGLFSAKKEVLAFTGLEQLTSHTLAGWLEENLDEASAEVWPRTDEGKLKTDAHTFADFSHIGIVEPFARFQKLEKITSAFGNNLINFINPATGKIHCGFKIAGARTGRLSASNPNVQQMPRDPSFRKLFNADVGTTFIVSDLSQIELRIAAEVSQDPEMLRAFREGIDLHKLTVSRLKKKSVADVTPEERRLGKALGLGLLYGLSHKKFAHYAKFGHNTEMSQTEAKGAVQSFRDTYPIFREWQIGQANRCQETYSVTSLCGKIRKLNTENAYGGGINHPIQSDASSVLFYAMCRANNAVKSTQAKLVSNVHDEIILQVPDTEDYKKWGHHVLSESMRLGFLDVFPNGITRGISETKIGKTWGEAKS